LFTELIGGWPSRCGPVFPRLQIRIIPNGPG
jgi:hypothetical protein